MVQRTGEKIHEIINKTISKIFKIEFNLFEENYYGETSVKTICNIIAEGALDKVLLNSIQAFKFYLDHLSKENGITEEVLKRLSELDKYQIAECTEVYREKGLSILKLLLKSDYLVEF